MVRRLLGGEPSERRFAYASGRLSGQAQQSGRALAIIDIACFASEADVAAFLLDCGGDRRRISSAAMMRARPSACSDRNWPSRSRCCADHRACRSPRTRSPPPSLHAGSASSVLKARTTRARPSRPSRCPAGNAPTDAMEDVDGAPAPVRACGEHGGRADRHLEVDADDGARSSGSCSAT